MLRIFTAASAAGAESTQSILQKKKGKELMTLYASSRKCSVNATDDNHSEPSR